MYKQVALFVAGLILAAGTAAFAQTTVDTVGRVVHVDPGAQVIVLDNNQAFRVTPSTVLFVGDRPVALGTVQPGQTVVVRSGEPVAIVPSASVAGHRARHRRGSPSRRSTAASSTWTMPRSR
jgi:hypothetical protein